jgi:hypothetical protein
MLPISFILRYFVVRYKICRFFASLRMTIICNDEPGEGAAGRNDLSVKFQ